MSIKMLFYIVAKLLLFPKVTKLYFRHTQNNMLSSSYRSTVQIQALKSVWVMNKLLINANIFATEAIPLPTVSAL